MMRVLLDSGYTGSFAAEHFGSIEQLKCMERSAAFLKRVLGEKRANNLQIGDTMENHRILIVEDDEAIAGAVSRIIESWGLTPRCVRDFRDVLREFTDFDPHLVLMDITLPFFNGYHWCSEIRKISAVPIIFVSSASENMNIVMAVDMGGDDFIAKPFDPSVLMAKIRAVLRRTYDLGDRVPVIERGGAVLNLNDETVTHDGQKVQLTRNEFRILQTLMESRGKVVSRETLMTRPLGIRPVH